MECPGESAAMLVMEGVVSLAERRKCSCGEGGTSSILPGGLSIRHHYLNVEAEPVQSALKGTAAGIVHMLLLEGRGGKIVSCTERLYMYLYDSHVLIFHWIMSRCIQVHNFIQM